MYKVIGIGEGKERYFETFETREEAVNYIEESGYVQKDEEGNIYMLTIE